MPSPARERPTPLTAEAVVVRLALRPSALKSNFVDGVLNANGILIEPTPASLSGVLARRQRSQPPAEANSAEESPSRDNQTTPLEIMLVDSPIPPVVDVVSELNRDLFNCVSIDVKGVGADTPPAAYNTYQQRVIDNRAAAASLGVYARGVGKHRSDLTQQEMGTSFKGKRQSASPPPERLATKPDRLADPGGVPRGLAYKLRPVGDLDTQDERRLYEQLGLLANQAVLHNRRVGQDRAAGRTGGLGGFGGAQADLLSDASELRLPVVLVCEPAADAPPRDAAPPQDDS